MAVTPASLPALVGASEHVAMGHNANAAAPLREGANDSARSLGGIGDRDVMNPIEVPRGLPAAERETVIQFDEESKFARIWSASPKVLRKLARLGLVPVRESRRRSGELWGKEFKVPLPDFRWQIRPRRQLSASEREARTQQLLQYRRKQDAGQQRPESEE